MRTIKYYDRIHRVLIDVEVTDAVAKFLLTNDKWLRRQQNKYNYYTISLDEFLNLGDESEEIILADTIEEKKGGTEKYLDDKTRKLYNLVWQIVEKLEDKEQKLIKFIFVERKSQRQIAKDLGLTESAVSQLKSTVLLHLTYYFYTDRNFMQTDIYQRNKREFDFDLIKVAKEIDAESGLNFDLNSIYDLTKSNTQTLKMLSNLGIELDDNLQEIFSFMNRIVKNALEELGVDGNTNKTIIIPKDLEIPREFKPKVKQQP